MGCKAPSIHHLALCRKRSPPSDPVLGERLRLALRIRFSPFTTWLLPLVSRLPLSPVRVLLTYSYRFSLCSSSSCLFFSASPRFVAFVPLSQNPCLRAFLRPSLPPSCCFLGTPPPLAGTRSEWPGPVFDNKDCRLPLVSFLTTYVTANNSFTCVMCLCFLKGLLKKNPKTPNSQNEEYAAETLHGPQSLK